MPEAIPSPISVPTLPLQVVVLASVGDGANGLGGGSSSASYRVTAADTADGAGATKGASGGEHAGKKKAGAAAAAAGGRKLVSEYREGASTSQPNAMDTMRPTAGEGERWSGWD